MIDLLWHSYETEDAWAAAVAAAVRDVIVTALGARGRALLALPGGGTPAPVYARLAAAALDWRAVTILPTDERLVEERHPLSNVTQLRRHFAALGAKIVALAGDVLQPQAAGQEADTRLHALPWPPDLVWLGMGTDGHTASIFAGPDLHTALTAPQRAVAVRPDPLPPEAPVPRITLTRSAILSARAQMLTLRGVSKRTMFEQALADVSNAALPLMLVLDGAARPVPLYWCP